MAQFSATLLITRIENLCHSQNISTWLVRAPHFVETGRMVSLAILSSHLPPKKTKTTLVKPTASITPLITLEEE